MDYQFQRIGKSEPTIAGNLSRVCHELVRLGKVGQSAAGRVLLAGEAFERFTPADLLGFLDPEGSEQGVSREQMQSARWLVIARNALLIGLVLFTWLSLSWMISQYQVDLATHPSDARQSFPVLWQQAFKIGNPLLPFLFFVIVEIGLAMLASRSVLRARLVGQKARACLEEAMRLLVPLLPPQSIPTASQMLVAQVDQAIDATAQQMKAIATDVRQSSDNFEQAVKIFESTTEKQREFAKVLEMSNERTEQIVKGFSDFQQEQAKAIQDQAKETRMILSSFASILQDQLKLTQETLKLTQETRNHAQETRDALQYIASILQDRNQLVQKLISELCTAKVTIAQQFDQVVQSLDTVTHSLNQTSEAIQRIESDTRSALEAIPKRLQEWRFSSSYPTVVQIETQQTLSVYSYMAVALQAILADLIKSKGRLMRDLRNRASVVVSQGAVISIIPTCEGIRFIPKRVSFNLLQNWGSADFAFVASKELAQKRRPIEITILAGPIIIASITMEISFVSDQHLHPTAPQRSISLPPLPPATPVAYMPFSQPGQRRWKHRRAKGGENGPSDLGRPLQSEKRESVDF